MDIQEANVIHCLHKVGRWGKIERCGRPAKFDAEFDCWVCPEGHVTEGNEQLRTIEVYDERGDNALNCWPPIKKFIRINRVYQEEQ